MDPDTIMLETDDAMEKAFGYMAHEFNTVRTGKASPSLVEGLDVEAYGSMMKLKALALITSPEPRLLVIQPFDGATVKAIEKAIRESKIGLNPAVDGKLIRIHIPELSEERRKDLVKTVKTMAEEARVRMRGFRRDGIDGMKKLEKASKITEDNLKDYEAQIQKMTDGFVKKIDEAVTHKEAEIMKV